MLTTFFAVLKLCTRRGYVKLDNDVAALQRAIEYLKQPKRERQSREERKRSDVELTEPSGADLNSGNEKGPESSHERQEG